MTILEDAPLKVEDLADLRGGFPDTKKALSEYIFTSKYARYLEDEGRRETWDEAVDRVLSMHLRKFKDLDEESLDEIMWAFSLVRQKRVLPSMRSLQFGGKAIEAHHARGYNCSTLHVDSIRSFAESFYLLLCGCGVGYGISDEFLSRLPNLVGPEDKTGIVMSYVIEDTIEGWADSIEALMNCYFESTAYSGRKIVFDYSRIRAKGAPLKTSGGKAPGHEGLKAAHIKIKALLDRIIEEEGIGRLRTIDAYDILMHTADATLSGGVRRSASSVIFDKDDELMMNAKTGDWFKENPQRGRSNNSVRLIRGEVTLDEFLDIFQKTREWGEPGFTFTNDSHTVLNPCFEVGMRPITDDGVCGVQFCNLCSINGSLVKDETDFLQAAKAAAIIGTLQAAYTDFKYLGVASQKITEQEALLGVSITAMMDNVDVNFDPEVQRRGANLVVEVNKDWADRIGINQAARTTVIKPEGTSTLAVGSLSSGIHASHSRYFFKRVQANKEDNVYKFFQMFNSGACEPSVWSSNQTDDVVTFPIALDDDVLVKDQIDALTHLDMVRSTQRNWVNPGATEANERGLSNNVSCTVVVQDHEWDAVARFVYDNSDDFTAVSFLAASGDKDYAQAPNEAVSTEDDVRKFIALMDGWNDVDYRFLLEQDDATDHTAEAACAGGGCVV